MRRTSTALALVALALSTLPAAAATLDDIRARDTFRCGLVDGFPGLSALGKDGKWAGFAYDYCRAAAAAILGSPDKVTPVKLEWSDAMASLQRGAAETIDIGASMTLGRDVDMGFEFVGPTLHSGLGFLTTRKAATVLDLKGAKVCVVAESAQEDLVTAFLKPRGIAFQPVAVAEAEVFAALEGGRCEVVLVEPEYAGAARLALKKPETVTVLPERIDHDMTGPLARGDDPAFVEALRWIHNALVTAEALGLTSANVAAEANREDPRIAAFLGKGEEVPGAKLGLPAGWTAAVVAAVGNYGEIYDRNYGVSSPFRIPRGRNALIDNGGLMVAPAWR
jgi:general L-amino acid transport system substrate-binding protein